MDLDKFWPKFISISRKFQQIQEAFVEISISRFVEYINQNVRFGGLNEYFWWKMSLNTIYLQPMFSQKNIVKCECDEWFTTREIPCYYLGLEPLPPPQ